MAAGFNENKILVSEGINKVCATGVRWPKGRCTLFVFMAFLP